MNNTKYNTIATKFPASSNRSFLKKNYTSFWMDDNSVSRFSGLSSDVRASSDIAKLIKLTNYRRAITNFVKIVTKQEIPVLWSGDSSFTDGKAINITTSIKDDNFDVVVGLALHEASHIILSDFKLLWKLADHQSVIDLLNHPSTSRVATTNPLLLAATFVKPILNWIEDRRIDNYIFTTSPGYKAYYHKLYDYYWNDPVIIEGLASSNTRKITYGNYVFHVMNMISPGFDPNALPELAKIAEVIDLPNINRLTSTEDALIVAVNVLQIIFDAVSENAGKPQEDTTSKSSKELSSKGLASKGLASTEGQGTLSTQQQDKLEKAVKKQKDFLSGWTDKKDTTKKLQRNLQNISKLNLESQTVTVAGKNLSVLVEDVTTLESVIAVGANHFIAMCSIMDRIDAIVQLPYSERSEEQLKELTELIQLKDIMPTKETLVRSTHPWYRLNALQIQLTPGSGGRSSAYSYKKRMEAVQTGLEMGGLLGKQLKMHNESRERVDMRLLNGKIDNRRLAHAGYGIESVFKQISTETHKKANIHISLDASGSMEEGDKWLSTIRMAMAIVKAAKYTQKIRVQVSVRSTHDQNPWVGIIYDSKKNTIQHLINYFYLVVPVGRTPEGLVYEALTKKNLLIKGSSELDSYFINISDGMPDADNYGDQVATNHTAKTVKHIKSLDIKVLSFFISRLYVKDDNPADYELAVTRMKQQFETGYQGRCFKAMYGPQATVVDPKNTIAIAKELNKKLLAN